MVSTLVLATVLSGLNHIKSLHISLSASKFACLFRRVLYTAHRGINSIAIPSHTSSLTTLHGFSLTQGSKTKFPVWLPGPPRSSVLAHEVPATLASAHFLQSPPDWDTPPDSQSLDQLIFTQFLYLSLNVTSKRRIFLVFRAR